MSKLAFVLAAMIGFTALGCDDETIADEAEENPPPLGDDLEPVAPVAGSTITWRAALVAVDASATLTGDVVVTQVEGAQSFTATITVANDTLTCKRPWAIHQGTCATGGPIVGTAAAYPHLDTTSNGAASATTTIATGLDPALSYFADVRFSASEVDRVLSCGDLVITSVTNP